MKLYAKCIKPSSSLIKNKIYLVAPMARRNIGTTYEYYYSHYWDKATHVKVLKIQNKGGYTIMVKKDRFERVQKHNTLFKKGDRIFFETEHRIISEGVVKRIYKTPPTTYEVKTNNGEYITVVSPNILNLKSFKYNNMDKTEPVSGNERFQQPKQEFEFEIRHPEPIYNLYYYNHPERSLYGVPKESIISSLEDNSNNKDAIRLDKIFYNGETLVTECITNKIQWQPKIP